MVIKCPKCNHYVSDTTTVCPHCGAVLKEGAPVQTQEPASALQEEEPKTKEEEVVQPVNPPVEKPVEEVVVEEDVVEEPVKVVSESVEPENVVSPVPEQQSAPIAPQPSSAPVASAPSSAPTAPPPVAYQQAEKSNVTLYAVIAVLALLICGIGGYIFMNSNKEVAPAITDSQDIQAEIDYGKINGILNEIDEHGFSNPSFAGFCPDVNHPHMIDLGLPSGTKWACSNVEAENPCQEGKLWDWHQVKKSKDLPTDDQANELVSSCQFTITKKGIRVIGANGNCIYFPLNRVYIPWDGEKGYQTVPSPTLWTRSGEEPWFAVYTPGEIINGTAANGVKYAARFVSK